MADCNTCEYENICTMPEFVRNNLKACKVYEPKKKKTNADRIRTMNDEELAEFFIHTRTNCEICNCLTKECLMDCSNGILEWLQSEADTKGE